MDNQAFDTIRDFIANNKKLVRIALIVLFFAPIIIYFTYMELNYGRIAIVAGSGLSVDSVLYMSPDEPIGTQTSKNSVNVVKGEYLVEILLSNGAMYLTTVDVQSYIRPTRIRPKTLDLEPEQLSGRLYENITPLRNGVVMGYKGGMIPQFYFPREFQHLNLGLWQVDNVCRVSNDFAIMLGREANPSDSTTGYSISAYNMTSDTYHIVQMPDVKLVSGAVDAFCGRDVMYVVDRAKRVVYAVGLEKVTEIETRDSEMIASADNGLVISANNTHTAILYGSDFVDPFSISNSYCDEAERLPINTDRPISGDIEWPDENHDEPKNCHGTSVKKAKIVITSKNSEEDDVVIELGERNDIFAVSLSPSSNHLAIISSNSVTVYNATNGAKLYMLSAIAAVRENLVWQGEKFFLLTNSSIVVSDVTTRETFSIMAREKERAIHKLSMIHDGYLYFTVNQRERGAMIFAAYRVKTESV